MTVNDQKLEELIVNRTPVTFRGKEFIIERNPKGSCDNCYFYTQDSCPSKAITICCSNGGNILKLKDNENV